MNKIFNVNLGGYPFTIDEDAYHAINKYLSAIQAHFADSDGCDEILDDIEARIAELFTEFLEGKSIVSIKEYNAVVKVMGRPEDFGAEAIDEEIPSQTSNTKKSNKKGRYSHIKTGKRLFRDEDDKVIGGVCAGVAAYFGIADPLWIRLSFLALVFLGGVSVIMYPILWIIVPKATTAGDKLKMRGEPATVSNIAKTVEEELNELSDKITEISKDLGSKKKIKSTSFFSPKNALSGLIAGMGRFVMGILKVIKAIVKPIFSLTLGVLLLALGITWAAWIISFLSAFSFFSYIGPSNWLVSTFGGLSLFFTVGIPILGLMLLITRWFSTYRIPKQWRTNLRLGWVASFLMTVMVGIGTGMSFNHEADTSSRLSYNINEDVIKISELEVPENKVMGFVRLPHMYLTKGGILNENVHYTVQLSNEEEVVIKTNISSHGSSFFDAQELANKVDVEHQVDGNEIKIPKNYKIKRGSKFRGQNVEYVIYIPEGKTVEFDESISNKMWHGGFFKNGDRPNRFDDYKWMMTSEGLVSDEWDSQYNATRKVDVKNLANLNIDGRMRTTITRGDKTEITLSGRKSDLDRIDEITTNDATSLVTNRHLYNRVTLNITTPSLKTLQLKNLASLKIEGFKQDAMEINYNGNEEMKAYIDVKNLTCNIGGSNTISLIGSGENLNINILGGARVKAEQFKAKNVSVTGNLYNSSSFYASEAFDCPSNETRNVTLYGNPELLAANIEQH